jgi:hypothetical protein
MFAYELQELDYYMKDKHTIDSLINHYLPKDGFDQNFIKSFL